MSGLLGWSGAALLITAIGCQLVAVLVLLWLGFNKDPSPAAPWIVVLLVSFPVGAAAPVLWRIGRRRVGALPPSLLPTERRKELIAASAVTYLGSALGIAGFLYLAFTLEGGRRLAFALAAFFLGTAISDLGAMRLYDILRVRFPSAFGLSQKRAWVFFGLSLVSSGLFFLIGLLWPNIMSMR